MIMRIVGDISIEQTTVQGPDGINYRIGSPDSGSWYYARDEVYQYQNPFPADEDNEGTKAAAPQKMTRASPSAMSSQKDLTHSIGRIIGQ